MKDTNCPSLSFALYCAHVKASAALPRSTLYFSATVSNRSKSISRTKFEAYSADSNVLPLMASLYLWEV